MSRRDGDGESGVPEGGKAAARQRQFMESRGLISDENNEDEEEDGGQTTQETAPGEQARGYTDKDDG
jgi:hypothetical protein